MIENMKKFSLFFSLVWLAIGLCLSSCTDNNEQAVSYDDGVVLSKLVGKWCTISDAGDYVIMNIENNHIFSSSSNTINGSNRTESQFNGNWSMLPGSSEPTLSIRGRKDYNTVSSDLNYKIKYIDDNEMRLLNMDIGAEQIFYHLGETIEIFQGETLNIPINKIYNTSLIDPQTYKGLNFGFTFVETLISGVKLFYGVRILDMTEKFLRMVNLPIDDIKKDYPEYVENNSLVYKGNKWISIQSNLPSVVQELYIDYDPDTHEVAMIQVYYKDNAKFTDTVKYLDDTYNQEEHIYYDSKSAFEGSFMVHLISEWNGIQITNTRYFLLNRDRRID